ncbi:MAG: OmpW family protein [Rickettsiales bacterium]|nr:MAG: OmpW family protein [Rickettsiales bacterium]
MKISKILKNISLISLLTMSSAIAAQDKPYNISYENEGQMLFKMRGAYANVKSKPKKYSSDVAALEKPGELVSSSYGADGAVTYFFMDNVAAELSAGFNVLRVKKSSLINAASKLGNGRGKIDKNNDIYMVPVTATLQFHVAPFGAIRPYVGGGFHGSYMYSRTNGLNVGNGFGAVAQAGVDIFAKNDTFFTFDVRQHFLQTNLTFKRNLLGNREVKSKVAWNPLIVSAGIGFTF